jgi:hypothetical protein
MERLDGKRLQQVIREGHLGTIPHPATGGRPRCLSRGRLARYQTLRDLLFDLGPVDAALRNQRVAEYATTVQSRLGEGDLDGAQMWTHKVLELNPDSQDGLRLRAEIVRRKERQSLWERVKSLVASAEDRFGRGAFGPAAEAFEDPLKRLPPDSPVQRLCFTPAGTGSTGLRPIVSRHLKHKPRAMKTSPISPSCACRIASSAMLERLFVPCCTSRLYLRAAATI